tara:strand:+ start:215 stop:778 length:564 start_codon:yes stop_codon:yes gene_type:complete
MKTLKFLKESLKNIRQIGSIFPSSRFVVRKMIEPIDFEKNITILELGSGTGVITKQLLEKMNSNSRLICFETNQKFCQELEKIKNQKMTLINESAETMKAHIEQLKIEQVDYIVSSVPLMTIPQEITNKILTASVEILENSGKLIQLQYTKVLDKKIRAYYNQIDITFTPKYYLPAFIYTCYNKNQE